MDKDDIIRMAREVWGDDSGKPWHESAVTHLEAFAALVAAAERERLKWDGLHSCHPECDRPACVHTRKAVEAEREACAKVCEEYQDSVDRHKWPNGYECAAAIRARGQG